MAVPIAGRLSATATTNSTASQIVTASSPHDYVAAIPKAELV
jgi:hypothetical protein